MSTAPSNAPPRLVVAMVLAATVLCLACMATIVAAEETWPSFRGPGDQGHSDAKNLPVRWSEKENVVWKTPIEGKAWSSPIVWGNRVFLTTVVGGEDSNPPKGKVEGGEAFANSRILSSGRLATTGATCETPKEGDQDYDDD